MTQTTQASLACEPRTKLGTRAARRERSAGRIPANLQDRIGGAHLDFTIDEHAFMSLRRHHQHLYELAVGGRVETALVQSLDWDVFGDRVRHIEFRRVDRNVKTDVEVELTFIGHTKGVLNHLLTHITLRALPTEIPNEVEVPVEGLDVGATVTAGALKLPPNVELVTPKEAIVARISQIKIEIVEPTPEAAAATVEGATAAAPAAPGAPGAPGAAAAAPGAEKKSDKKPEDKKGGDRGGKK